MKQESKSMKIGLVFPELRKHDLDHFKGILDKKQGRLDLIVFPISLSDYRNNDAMLYYERVKEIISSIEAL